MRDPLSSFLSEEKQELLNLLYDAVYVVDNERRIAYWNHGAEQLTGYSAQEVIGRSCRENILNHLDECGNLLCNEDCPLQHTLDSGEAQQVKVYPLHKEGHRIVTSTHASVIRDEKGQIIGAIEIFRDITAEEKLRVLQEKFEKLIKQYVSDTTYTSVREAAQGKRERSAVSKDLTVFFMDIVGFTSLSEKLLPQEIVSLLNTLFEVSAQIIHQHLGDIDKFIGDCIMAVFIDADDAIKAAQTILSVGMPALNRTLAEMGLPTINVRIGINSGVLVQGDVGSEERKDLTVIGDVVNIASRVESVAKPGTFRISESTLARLSKPEDFVFEDELLLKGKSQHVKVYRRGVSISPQ